MAEKLVEGSTIIRRSDVQLIGDVVMNQFQRLLYENQDGIGIVTINRPEALNALNAEVMQELDSLVNDLSEDDSVKVVIITGAGGKAFVAGADIGEMRMMSAITGREWGKTGQAVFREIENLPKPVIAAVNGFALGGGCELAMACDIRLASDKARFGQPEVSLGIVPGFGGTQRLARLVGRGLAKEMLFTGGMIDAAEAYRIGLVSKLVPAAELMAEAISLARKIMANAPVAVRLAKAAVNEGLDADLETGVAYEAEVFGLCFATADQKEGMTAFIEKRKAGFSGR